MFNNLTERLEGAFKNLKGEARISDLNIANTLKDIRRALIDADVNYKIAKDFTDRVKDKAIGEKVLNAVSPGQQMVKIVKDELADLMGGTEANFNSNGTPAVILIAGLQGSGKTTFSGKLANYLKTKKGKSPLLVAADVYRPAAIDQLTVLAGQIGVDIYTERENKNPVSIANAGNHTQQVLNVSHLLNLLKLVKKILEIELISADFFLQFLRLFLIKLFLRFLNE